MTTVYAKLQVRRDTAANWEAANPVLAEGESGFTTDTQIEKIGDGVRAWNDLPSRPSLEQLTAAQDAAQAAAEGAAQSKIDASDSADLSQKWAEGHEPGGPDTKSAKEYADLAEEILGQTMDVFDHFDDRYLGAYVSDPATDNDGNTLIAGTLYFNTALPGMKVYTGSETKWVAAYIPGNSLGTAAIRDAQTSPTDATLLRLLQVGAFGLGLTDAPAITDLTDAIPNGFFSFSEATVTGYPTAEAYNQMGFAVSSSSGTMVLTMRQSNNAAYAQPMLGVRLSVGAFVWMKLQTDAQVSSDPDLANEPNKLPTRDAVAGAIAAISYGSANAGLSTGSVGTYAWLAAPTGTQVTAGSTYAGSDLHYGGGYGNETGVTFNSDGVSVSGTWRAMGNVTAWAGRQSHTIFLRIV